MFFALILVLILAACGAPPSSIQVPTYATGKAIVESVFDKLGINQQINYKTFYMAENKNDEAGFGLVAILVPKAELNKISNKTFTDFGQNCIVKDLKKFSLVDSQLVVPFKTTTGIDSFVTLCLSQIPAGIESYYIYLEKGDGYNTATWFKKNLPVVPKRK